MNFLYPLAKPKLPSAEQVAPYLIAMDRRLIYSNFGPTVRSLEEEIAAKLHVPASRVVAMASATTALQGCIAVSDADHWYVPDFTFVASAYAVIQAKKQLSLVDVREHDLTMDYSLLSAEGKGCALLPVMPFGQPVSIDKIPDSRDVVIDAAASLGTFPNLSMLPPSWAVVFSLHATKVLPAGEGGIAVLGNDQYARALRAWSNFGLDGSRISEALGTNAKLSEVSACYALASLHDWDSIAKQWLDALHISRELTSQILGLGNIAAAQTPNSYWIADLGSFENRVHIETVLTQARVETRSWWPSALHDLSTLKHIQLIGSGLVSRSLSRRLLGLPMYRGLDSDLLRLLKEALS